MYKGPGAQSQQQRRNMALKSNGEEHPPHIMAGIMLIRTYKPTGAS